MYGKRQHRAYVTNEGYKQVYKPSSPEARSNGYVAVHRGGACPGGGVRVGADHRHVGRRPDGRN